MKVSLKWLEDYVRVDVPVAKLVELLDLSGTKVEAVIEPGKGIEGIVVAEVLAITPHPNADNLSLVDISAGGEQERVVCGAKNFAVGDKVPYAALGARLPELQITERKIRGEVSRGMLCSGSELGVTKDHSGLLILPGDAELGADVVGLLNLNDTILDLEITPNRPDCMGMIGVAREVAALLGNDLHIPELSSDPVPVATEPVSVRLEDAQGCPRYVAHLILDVAVGPSVGWMAARLLAAGVRPISNVVDATNYILLETGHPLHAFDAQKVHDRSIIVRRAFAGEKLTTLDGVERTLDPADLVIADPKKPLALAGIMGGASSEVGDSTTEVILEAAYFEPGSIGRTGRRLGLRTEASARFERGADPDSLMFAAARCAQFISLAAGARPSVQIVDEYPVPIARRHVTLRPERTVKVLGFEISARSQAEHLRSVHLVVDEQEEILDVEVPRFRPDIEREVDLIEEVARLAGLDHLPSTLPKGGAGGLSVHQSAERTLRRTLAGAGVEEAWTSSLGSSADLDAMGLPNDHPARNMVALMNPMSEQENRLRTSLLPGLLKAAAHNVAHRVEDVALFEIARIYEPASDSRLPQEPLILGGVFTGHRRSKTWLDEPRRWGFFEAKGVLTSALGGLGAEVSLTPTEGAPFHPTRAAIVMAGERTIGSIGELHPQTCDRLDLPEGTVVFEVALGPVFDQMPGKVKVSELPRFPAALIDLAVVVDETVPAASIETAIVAAGVPELTEVKLFDLYRGEQIPDGKKSLAYSLRLQAADRTLTDEDSTAVLERVVGALREKFGAELRG
ncbi:MAG: phenylalanyl-tRNA synthetase beta chain [Actinomycetota bacterium]|jgi:phenylalanyl-tRNA synthetase beta chain|nr:phenylalanyl-tRNA synthetase beta chain [Actinomycetota bacterium]